MTEREVIIRNALKSVHDPELQFSIVDLGLVYEIRGEAREILVRMGLTSPFCPFQDSLKAEVKKAVVSVVPEANVTVEFVLDPPWSAEKASQEVQQQFVLQGIPLTRF